MTRRVLVTGGAGFIGSHVVDAYRAAGWSVTVLDALLKGHRRFVPDDVELHVIDIRSPEARALVAAGRFDVVNHQAAQMDVRVSVADPAFDADTNVLGGINLLEGARLGGVRRFVFASSGGVVYGEREPPASEDTPKLPASPYGVSKLASEYYLSVYRQLHGIEGVSMRYANVYGPRQDPHGEAGVVAIFGERVSRGEPLTVFGEGRQTRDYVFVGDVARANVVASEVDLPTPTSLDCAAYNIGTGVETSVLSLAETFGKIVGRPIEIRHEPARAGELERSALAIDKAWRELDWRPAVPLEEGLRRTYEWITGA